MKTRTAFLFLCNLLAAWALFTGNARAQTKAYRQTNLASSVPGSANNTAPSVIDPWAIAFLPGQPFFIADSGSGSINSQNSSGSQAGIVRIPSSSGSMRVSVPTGIASDGSGAFGPPSAPLQYIVVTQGGTIAGFSTSDGKVPAQATLVRDDSAAGAVYTAVALLHPNCCAPLVAVADFNDGSIHTFTNSFAPLDGSASFQDPHLPPSYAPYGMQVIGNQLFVTYAVQNAAKNGPVVGAGNGVVNVFDLQGNFVRRFAMGGSLNAPWGVALASSNFGPFSGAILIGNFGDGTVSAFDQATGNFLGQLKDGDGNPLVNPGVRGLAFRADGAADPNTLFFTADGSNGQGGLFGAITAGLVSITRASASEAAANKSSALTVTVAAGPGNSGTPTGTVTVSDRGVPQGASPVVNGLATLALPAAGMGTHAINVQYSGDTNFVPSSTSAAVTTAAAAAADFSVTASPNSVSVSPGQSAPVMVAVTPSGGFNSSVALSCSSVAGVTCTFGSATLSTANGAASTTMTINTTMNVPRYGFLPLGGAGLGGLLAALALVDLAIGRLRGFGRARVPVLTTAAGLAILAFSLTLGGCGYGSSYTAPQNAGPAVMTITAQSGMITHTATVNVTVH